MIISFVSLPPELGSDKVRIEFSQSNACVAYENIPDTFPHLLCPRERFILYKLQEPDHLFCNVVPALLLLHVVFMWFYRGGEMSQRNSINAHKQDKGQIRISKIGSHYVNSQQCV